MRLLVDRFLDAENFPGFNRTFGRRQQSLMRKAGFVKLETTVRYPTEFVDETLPMLAASLDAEERLLVNLGVISERELADSEFRSWLSSGIREWLAIPDAVCGPRMVWQTVGYKPE